MAHPHLDRRITIQSATETQDANGQPIPAWADFITSLPAEYLPVSGAEQFQAQQVLARAVAKFRIRWRDDLTREMRVVFDSVTFDLRHFEEDRRFDRRQYMILSVEAVPVA
jgi:SPP1 family predicted phage head-tail adaptor